MSTTLQYALSQKTAMFKNHSLLDKKCENSKFWTESYILNWRCLAMITSGPWNRNVLVSRSLGRSLQVTWISQERAKNRSTFLSASNHSRNDDIEYNRIEKKFCTRKETERVTRPYHQPTEPSYGQCMAPCTTTDEVTIFND